MFNYNVTSMKHALRYWHPVAFSEQLQLSAQRPLPITICGENIIIFRTSSGQLGALHDRCPHRGAPLSLGCIKGEHVACKYHGWTYDNKGAGSSPSGSRASVTVESFDVAERYGFIWVKTKGSDDKIPDFDDASYRKIASKIYPANVPFELFVDNMLELEHSPTVHDIFGFDFSALQQMKYEDSYQDDRLHVLYEGQQRKLPFYMSVGTGVKSHDNYKFSIDMRFAPVYAIYDHEWYCAKTGKKRDFCLRFVIYFTPVTEKTCRQFTIFYAQSSRLGRLGFDSIIDPILRHSVDMEVGYDIQFLESLRPELNNIDDFQLGRFDRPIIESRKRIKQLYFEEPQTVVTSRTIPIVQRSVEAA